MLQTNSSKEHIKASHLVPKYPPKSKDGKLPCVVYCHCNSGSRRDSEEALHLLLPQNITVFALDFVVLTSGYLESYPVHVHCHHLSSPSIDALRHIADELAQDHGSIVTTWLLVPFCTLVFVGLRTVGWQICHPGLAGAG